MAYDAIANLDEEDLRYIENFVLYLRNKQALPPGIGTKSAGWEEIELKKGCFY